jgi:hypothetical protein
MTTPSEPPDPTRADAPRPASAVEDLRERLRPRSLRATRDLWATPSERLALERVQALELQVSTAQQRERELLELAVRDGNQIASLQARVTDLGDLAARTEVAERYLFESEGRANDAVRRAELMDGELMATRAEVDRLRARVVALEGSLRRALVEVGEATIARPWMGTGAAGEDVARMEGSARRALELADRLRLKVVTLESSLRSLMADAGDETITEIRAAQAERDRLAAEEARAGMVRPSSAEAEARLADLKDRLASLDARIAGLSASMRPSQTNLVVDIRDAEAEAERATEIAETSEPIKPPASRWSEWRTT